MAIASEVVKKKAAQKPKTTIDISDISQLKAYAASKGLKVEENKPSLFVRMMDVISRPLYASAGAAKAVVKGNENPLSEAWKGLKGEEKETYSDVLKEAGVENKFTRALVGFGLDVALDPTTYVGGTLLKGVGKVAKVGATAALDTTRFFNPRLAAAVEATGQGLKDAFGSAFKYGYGASEGLADDVNRYHNKLGIATEDTVKKINESFKALPRDQHKEFARTLLDFRKQLPELEKGIKTKSIKEFNELFAKDYPIEGIRHAEQRFGGAKNFEKKFEDSASRITGRYQDSLSKLTKKLEGFKKKREVQLAMRSELLEEKIGQNVTAKAENLNKRLENVLKDELDIFTGDLIDIQDMLKGGITKEGLLKGTMKELPEATADEFDDVVKSALGPIRDELELAIKELEQEVLDSSGKEFLSKGLGFTNSKEAIAKMLQGKIIKNQNDYNDLVFRMEDKINEQLNKMREMVAGKIESKQNDVLSKIIKIQNDISAKKNIAETFFSSRGIAKSELNKLTPKFTTKEQAVFFQGTYKKIIDDMAESAGLPIEQRFAAYFPSIDVDKLKPVMSGRAVSVSDKSYLDVYKGAVKSEKELDKPVEALARTQAKILRDNMAKSTLDDAVRLYGVSKETFEKMADDVFEKTYGAPKDAYKMIKDKNFGKEVGYLKEADFNFINNYLHPDLKVIDMLAKHSGYDLFNKTFKTFVTSYFPAFHIRNAASGMIQNYQALGAKALDPTNIPTALSILKGADKQVKLGNKIFRTKDLHKVLQENFGKTSRYIADLGEYIEDLGGGKFRVMSKLNPRRLGDFIEMNQKSLAMVTALKQGKSIDEAVKLAEMAGFNYQKLTKFESKIMRRIIPFYAFMRKNAELQIRTLATHPERILNQKKVADALSNMFGERMTEEDMKGVPSWALEGLGFKIKDNKYVASFGVPLEEFVNRINNPMMSTLSSLTPLIKYPLESKMGYDFFRERKIIDLNKISPVTGKLLMDAQESGKMPEWLSQAINIDSYKKDDGSTQYTMSPKALHLLRNIPTSRFQNTFEKLLDKDLDSANKFAALFTGGKIYDIDIEQQQYFTERDLRRDIEDWLLSIGEGKRFEKFYVPKED